MFHSSNTYRLNLQDFMGCYVVQCMMSVHTCITEKAAGKGMYIHVCVWWCHIVMPDPKE